MTLGQIFVTISTSMVIVIHIWQKLNTAERKATLIVTNFW